MAVHNHRADPGGNRDPGDLYSRPCPRPPRQGAHGRRTRAAGRAVQHVLIPEDVPAIPGFIVQSVYKPFGEVGGDFFQVLPINALPISAEPINSDPVSGGVLVIIGDVSGKGMPAAMTVSLLVGTVRTLATLHPKPRRNSGRHEPAHARPQPRRLHYLPGPPRRC